METERSDKKKCGTVKYVLVLLPFLQMSIKHKKSLFSNITRDYNYHKSIFYATLNFHNVPLLTVRVESVIICINGWGRVLRIISHVLHWIYCFCHKLPIVSWDIYFQDLDFDFTLVISCEESSSFRSFYFNLQLKKYCFFKHVALLRCRWMTNVSFCLWDFCLSGAHSKISIIL